MSCCAFTVQENPMHKLHHQHRRNLAFAALLLSAALSAAVFAVAHPKNPSGSAIFQPDKGNFAIQVDGQTVAQESFEISPSGTGWLAKGMTKINVPQSAPSTVPGSLTLQSDGSPISYDWTAQAEKTNGAHIAFANGIAKVTLEMQGARPFQQDMSFNTPLVVILDNNLYHQYAVLARLYDWQKSGPQTFPVLIPQELTPGSITIESTGTTTADGKPYIGLRASTSDLQVLLYLDQDHRLDRIEVPSAKVVIVRQ
jgi:hypothetical protein